MRKVERLQESEMDTHFKVLNGRQVLYQICLFLRTGAALKNYYNIEQLTELRWLGDSHEQINRFLIDWLCITTGMKTTLKNEEFAELLHGRMKESNLPTVRTTCEMYRRASHDNPGQGNHSYPSSGITRALYGGRS